MAAIHFFTETSKLKTQSSSDAYGPVVGSLNTEYRTTLKGFLNADAKAIAVCQCKVYLQPGASSNLVNAILVPVLPNIDLNTGYTPVRYFIYRGLKKSDILDGSNEIITEDPTNNGLVAKLWTNFNTLVADKASSTEPITATKPNAKALGWQYATNPTTDLMEKIIYETDDDHEVISVAGGTEIGEFVSGNEGFEIVLAERMYLPDLANIQAAETTITASAPSGGDIPGNEPIANMRKREEILNYIDPIAWYNLFHDVGVYEDGNSTPYKGFDNIYTTFLSDFATANTLYIDIRNENGYSLNYYKDNEGETSDSDYGMHLQLEVNGVNQSGIEYYTNYWPILTATIPANTTDDFNTLTLRFRKLYNPKPLIYADFAHEQSGNKLEQVTEHNKFEEESDLASPTADWSEDFVFEVPNLSSIGSAPTQIAWVMKLMNIRLEQPTTVTLPTTVLEKDTFLDNVFGPVNYLPDFAGSGTTQWISGLGKRYINGEGKTGIKGIYSIGIGYSPTVGTVEGDVVFFADLLDEHLNLPSIQERKFNVPTYSGSSLESNFTNYIYQNETKVKGLEFLKQELRGSTFNVLEQKPTNGESTVGTNLYLQMTKTEYDTLSTTGLSTDVQEPMIKFNGINNDTDLDAVPYRRAPIEVNGLDSSGNSFKVNGGFDVLTFNYDTLSTESKSDTVNVSEQENGILTIDEFIDALKVVEDIYKDNLIDTCTRLRVHYYGRERQLRINLLAAWKDTIEGIVFNNSLPLSSHLEQGAVFERYRRLYFKDFLSIGNPEIYWKLLSHADENGTKDNPSPYLKDGIYEIDLGQILYGFESIYYQPHEPITDLLGTNKPPNTTYSSSYENFPVKIVNDLAGWVANFATAIAEFTYHVGNGFPPPDREGFSINFNEYYDHSNPKADIHGNVDAIGIMNAYKVLEENPTNTTLKLSDVFTLYYKGVSFLRTGISLLTTPSKEFYTSSNRWKAFSKHFGFYRKDTSGNYFWVPDNTTEWNKVMADYSASNPTGRDYENRLFGFAEFWNTTLIKRTNPFLIHEFIDLSLKLRFNNQIPSLLIEKYLTSGNFDNSGLSQADWVKAEMKDFLKSVFLGYIKNKII